MLTQSNTTCTFQAMRELVTRTKREHSTSKDCESAPGESEPDFRFNTVVCYHLTSTACSHTIFKKGVYLKEDSCESTRVVRVA